jgi:hypothetical protein
MRFFALACLFGIFAASLGCMTRNWSSTLFPFRKTEQADEADSEELSIFGSRVMERELFGPDDDPRAQNLEERLGFDSRDSND